METRAQGPDIPKLRKIAIKAVRSRLSKDASYNVFYSYPKSNRIVFTISPQTSVLDGAYDVIIDPNTGAVLNVKLAD